MVYAVVTLIENCGKIKKVPPSLITNYEKFLNFFLPKNLQSLTVILPYEMMDESEKIREAVMKARPSCVVKILVDKDSKEIVFCL
ncbi:hypothetical protein Ahos_1432 [Acidianus hospitalis W1]|jgi:hypothetical protein|uniref:DUF4898 domain-containing protein n=2 Tax=Acidianus TaxID=12914 RepID=F4B513_ACIHW|nr:DUF4898 domain-containing protein [Acidianus hospitalis]AEE94315.1 hypothetical protein Ahos_1432 [Acidianus hospitalis W1]